MAAYTPTLLRSSTLYGILALIALAATAVYGVSNYRVFSAERHAIVDNDTRRAALESEFVVSRETFRAFAEERSREQAEFAKKIVKILPPDENYTDLTRQLDDYFAANDIPSNPIFQSSLRYNKGAAAEGMDGISMLPFNMNIETTRDNFFKFLDFVSNSGSLENGVRLMEITSIQLNFSEGGEVIKDSKQKLDVTLDMNAYYQTK